MIKNHHKTKAPPGGAFFRPRNASADEGSWKVRGAPLHVL